MASNTLFKGVNAIILEPGLGKARKKILRKKLEEKGGVSSDTLSSSVTHVLVGGNVKHSRIPTLLKATEIDKHVQILQADWISKCLTEDKLIDTNTYRVTPCYDTKPVSSLTSDTEHNKQPSVTAAGAAVAEQQTTESHQTAPTKQSQHFTSPVKGSPAKKSSAHGKLVVDSDDSDYVDSDDERYDTITTGSHDVTTDPPPAKKFKGRWVCEIPSTSGQPVNHNKHITDKLQELLQVYKNSTSAGDQWRVMGYTKAITALKNHPKEITTWEILHGLYLIFANVSSKACVIQDEIWKLKASQCSSNKWTLCVIFNYDVKLKEANSLPAVGKRLADKIWEIVNSGHLRRLDHIDEKQAVIDMFGKIWGVGPTCAQRFVALGYRTLDELRTSGELNRQQLIGLAHYDEFLERMPREEAAEIEQTVREATIALCPGAEAVACGSYRRGKKDCGDVDVLVTHPDGRSHKGLFTLLLQRLRDTGFITDDLTLQEDHSSQSKYLGVCKLPGEGRKHRRLDIIVVPYAEYPCALLYFTGSGHFNRSMRSKARTMGMSLSEHALRKNLIRKGQEKLFEGTVVPVFSEKDVFKHLDMKYLEPCDRNWD